MSIKPGPPLKDYAAMAAEQSVKREKLVSALNDSAPKIPCEPEDRYSLTFLRNHFEVRIPQFNELFEVPAKLIKEVDKVKQVAEKRLVELRKSPEKTLIKVI